MKYTQAIITLFSSNAMDTLITFFTKFSEVVLPVWCQRQSLSITHARILVSLVTFALRLTKVLLSALLSDGDYQYRDTRVASVLLDVHKVMCSAPYSTIISNSAPDVRIDSLTTRVQRLYNSFYFVLCNFFVLYRYSHTLLMS